MKRFFLLIFCILLINCRMPQNDFAPTIEFSKIPSADEGGPVKLDDIEGRVLGSRPGQQIVLFARSGTWWVQPLVNEPFTDIQSDNSWKASIHLGTEYAALLVEPDYRPPAQTDTLPIVGDGVVAVAVIKGLGEVKTDSNPIRFSGYEWEVRSRIADRSGTMTEFAPANVWTDEKGFLHLRIAQKSGQWTCAEISLPRSLGYGSYNFTIRDVSHLEPAAIFSIFTWDDLEAGQNHREMNLEITRWGDPSNKNMQYVIQPYYLPANVARFEIPAGVLTHSIRWEPGKVDFRTVRGLEIGKATQVVAEHTFTAGVPTSEGESLRINLYAFGYSKKPLQNETEVIIEKFEYLP